MSEMFSSTKLSPNELLNLVPDTLSTWSLKLTWMEQGDLLALEAPINYKLLSIRNPVS